jgi:hypothetical protein
MIPGAFGSPANRANPLQVDRPSACPTGLYVDALALSDTIGYVYLTVRRGEWVHRETFTLPRLRHGGWGVREARVWGAMQFLPPPGSTRTG